jgi:hypothetical protein
VSGRDPAIGAEVDQALAELLDKGFIRRITRPDGKTGFEVIKTEGLERYFGDEDDG